MRTKLVAILCLLLLTVTSLGFGVAFAAEGGSTEEPAPALDVVSIGWGDNGEQFKKGFTIAADRLEFQIWFSDSIRENTTTNLLGSESAIAEEVTQSALDYVEFNGTSLGEIFGAITAANGGKTDADGILQMHVQGAHNNLQFNVKKDNSSVAGGKYVSLDKCFFNLDGNGEPTADNFITVKKGFSAEGKTVAEDITFAYNPYNDGNKGYWCKYDAEEVGVTSVSANDKANDEVSIVVDFDKPVNKETVNHIARESEATVSLVNGQAKLDNVKANGLREAAMNKIAVNGYTIMQLMQAAKVDAPDGADVAGAVDVHVKAESGNNSVEIHIKNGFGSSVKLEDGLNVAIMKGFRSDLAVVSEDISYEYKDGMWVKAGETVVREELKVESVTSDNVSNNELAISIEFGGPVNKETVNHMARENEATVSGQNSQAALDNIKANGLRESVWNSLKLGDKTIKQLMEAMKADASNIPGGDYDGQIDVHVKAGKDGNRMEIHVKHGYAGSVKLEDGLTLTFMKGFRSDLITVSEDIVYTYIGGRWYAEGEEPVEQEEVTVTNVTHKVGTNDIEISLMFSGDINKEKVIHMARESEATVVGVNSQAALDNIKANGLRESVWHKIAFNGKTIWDMMQEAKTNPAKGDGDGADAIDVHIENPADGAAPANSARIVLKTAYNFLDFSKDIEVTVKSGFHSDMANVSADITYTYDADLKFWLAPGEEPPSFDEVQFVGVDAPVMKDAAANFNVEFVLHFNQDIATRQHAYISMPSDFVSSFVGSKGDYSASDLASFNKYGVFDSMARNIVVNGKSIYEMMKYDETKYPLAVQPAIAVVHVAQGGSGLDTLRIVIGGTRVEGTVTEDLPYRISDLEQNFVITVKAGLRTPLGQEVKEDMSFIYDPVTKQWYQGDSVEDIPVQLTVTLQDGDTVLKTLTCEKGGTVVPGIVRKEGYTFNGWFTDAALTQAWDSSAPVNENMTLYAKFTAIEQDPGDDDPQPGTGGCNSAVFGGSLVLAAGIAAAAAVLFKRRSNVK